MGVSPTPQLVVYPDSLGGPVLASCEVAHYRSTGHRRGQRYGCFGDFTLESRRTSGPEARIAGLSGEGGVRVRTSSQETAAPHVVVEGPPDRPRVGSGGSGRLLDGTARCRTSAVVVTVSPYL